ncbi:MAG TPA: manganese efflux pump [Bacteriovoracaceae bacterium]|nr:manganese efflux pump [Bacteriovoracaceae bacterium]
MFSVEILLLGLALAMDAAVVAFAIGLLHSKISPVKKLQRGLLVALLFGFSQFGMLWLGSYAGYLFSFSSYGYLFQFVVAAIFVLIAVKFFQESLNTEDRNLEWKLVPVLLLAFATSVDALAAGVSFGTLPSSNLAALEVGAITFGASGTFYLISQFLRHIPERWLLRFASLIFLVLGSKIIMEFFNKGYL